MPYALETWKILRTLAFQYEDFQILIETKPPVIQHLVSTPVVELYCLECILSTWSLQHQRIRDAVVPVLRYVVGFRAADLTLNFALIDSFEVVERNLNLPRTDFCAKTDMT